MNRSTTGLYQDEAWPGLAVIENATRPAKPGSPVCMPNSVCPIFVAISCWLAVFQQRARGIQCFTALTRSSCSLWCVRIRCPARGRNLMIWKRRRRFLRLQNMNMSPVHTSCRPLQAGLLVPRPKTSFREQTVALPTMPMTLMRFVELYEHLNVSRGTSVCVSASPRLQGTITEKNTGFVLNIVNGHHITFHFGAVMTLRYPCCMLHCTVNFSRPQQLVSSTPRRALFYYFSTSFSRFS